MHTYFNTLFRFFVFSKGLYLLLSDNSIPNSNTYEQESITYLYFSKSLSS